MGLKIVAVIFYNNFKEIYDSFEILELLEK